MSDVIPDGWKLQPVGSFLQLTSGKSKTKSGLDVQKGRYGIPVYGGNGINGYCDDVLLSDPTVIIGRVGEYCGCVHITSGKSWITDNALYIRSLNKGFDLFFVFQLLGYSKLSRLRKESGQPLVSQQPIYELKVLTPPLPEQQKIAAILSSVDDVIEKTQAQIEKLKDLKTGMMQELLSPREPKAGDQTVTQASKTNGLHHTEFKDSPLGRIPVGWEVVPLTKVISVKHGFQFRENHFSDHGIPIVKIGNLTWGNYVDMSGFSKVPQERFPDFTSYLLTGGEVLMALTGATLGKVSIYDANFPSLQNYRVGSFIPKNIRAISLDYIFWVLQSGYVQQRIEDLINQAAQPNIGKADLEGMNIPLPSLEEQAKITKALFSLFNKITMVDKKLLSLHSLKKALMQDLLTGKVRVQVDAA